MTGVPVFSELSMDSKLIEFIPDVDESVTEHSFEIFSFFSLLLPANVRTGRTRIIDKNIKFFILGNFTSIGTIPIPKMKNLSILSIWHFWRN